MILLIMLIGLSPILISGGLIWLYLVAPESLNVPVAIGYLLLQSAYGALLLGLVVAALSKRRYQSQWQAMEIIIIYSFVTVIFIGGWLSGTSFTIAILLLVLGVSVAAPLASAKRLKTAYLVSLPVFVIILALILSGKFRYAPLFSELPIQPSGAPKTFWLVFEFSVVIITLAILYIALISVDRWSNREAYFKLMSTEDGLTRLANRRTFLDRAQIEFARAQRKSDRHLACVLLDIDHFKQVNDTHGHPVGDAVLVGVASCLLSGARPYDEVGRYGGEEFILLLPDTKPDEAQMVAERLRASIENTVIRTGDLALTVTASFGVACYPSSNVETLEALIKQADDALYQAKKVGRNQVVMGELL